MSKYKLLLIFFDIYPQSTINQIYKSLNYLKKLTPINSKLMILDLTNFSFKKIKNNYIHSDEEIEYLKPNSLKELRKLKLDFKKYQKIYALGPVYSDAKSVFIFLILKYLNIKIILINYFGYFLNEQNQIKHNLIYKINRFFKFKFMYFISRIFSLFSIFPNIEHYFETSQIRIKQLNNTYAKKTSNLIKYFNFSYAKNVHRINSVYYDQILDGIKNTPSDKYTIIVDSGFDHPDRYLREKVINKEKHELDRKKYFENLYYFLRLIQNLYQNKIIFCKHPKTKYRLDTYYKTIEKEFDVELGRTDDLINSGELIIFTGSSSMVNKAIIQKKKIIYALSESIGKYQNDQILSFTKNINIPIINIEKINDININKLNNCINDSVNKYNEFIENNLIHEKNIFSFQQIKNILYE